jgi:branched-chain amino acid transport system substrate-binding protein
MTRNARWIVAAVAVACVLAGGCGQGAGEDPIRIAVLSDCVGAWGFAHEPTIAAAELPLLDRGGTLAASAPSAGVEGAEVAGRPVELQVACLSGQQNEDTLEARRVVELGDADVVIGPILGASGLVYRSYAKRHPDVTFVSGTGANPSTTLREPASNLYRFMTDGRQWSAGLGSYAYHELGWRKAAVVNEDYGFGWAQAGGFVAEFCSLGGTVVRASPRLGTADLGPTIATLSTGCTSHRARRGS